MTTTHKFPPQDSWNVFAHDWSNHVPATNGPLVALVALFATATLNPQQVGLSDFGRYGESGAENGDVVYPYKLVFRWGKNNFILN